MADLDEYDYLERQVDGTVDVAPVPEPAPAPAAAENGRSKDRERDRERDRDRKKDKEDRKRSRSRSKERSRRDRSKERSSKDKDRGDRDRRDRDRDRDRGDRDRSDRGGDRGGDRSAGGWDGGRGRGDRDYNRGREDHRGGVGGGYHDHRGDGGRRRARTPPEVAAAREQERELREMERSTRTVFAYNLCLKASEREVFEFFSQAGRVHDVKLITDKNTKRSKGFAYIEFSKVDEVLNAVALTGQQLMGQTVMVKSSEHEKNLAWEAQQQAKVNQAAALQVLGTVGQTEPQRPAPPAIPAAPLPMPMPGFSAPPFDLSSFAAATAAAAAPQMGVPTPPLLPPSLMMPVAPSAALAAALGSSMLPTLGPNGLAFPPGALQAPALPGPPPMPMGMGLSAALAAATAAVPSLGPALAPVGLAGAAGALAAGLCRLQVLNLNPAIGDPELQALFAPFGKIEAAQVVRDASGKSQGVGYVTYGSMSDATKAMQHWNGQEVAGQTLAVSITSLAAGLAGPPQEQQHPQSSGVGELEEEEEKGGLRLTSDKRAALMNKLAAAAGLPQVQAMVQPAAPTAPAAPKGDPSLAIMQGMLGPASPIPTPCILIKNMFSPQEESGENWDLEIAEDVKDECSKFGPVVHCFVDKNSQGFVYLRFLTTEAATAAQHSLNGRFFAKRQIACDFQFLQPYNAVFKLA